MLPLIGLIPLLPALGFAVCGLAGKRLPKPAVTAVACGSVLLAFLLSAGAVLELRSWQEGEVSGHGARSYTAEYWTWIPKIPFESAARSDEAHRAESALDAGSRDAWGAVREERAEAAEVPEAAVDAMAAEAGADAGAARDRKHLEVAFGFRLDPLSSIMILIVTGVGFLIHVYSAGYMGHDPGYARYFAYLNLFTAMMLTLVLGSNFLVMFVGWEGVGLCSYLLIGFWYQDQDKAQAGRKAFITNRIGDLAFILGLLGILLLFHTLDFAEVMAAIAEGGAPTAALTVIGLALFIGACGKSAQIPLFVWLPDAMAGPTPVSALIHAATMVTAGVYMVARCSVLYVHAPAALLVVAIVGAATALFAASIGLAQNDIKKVLAYSTVSQLGYMFLGAGVGAFAASIFHLMTHAFFKALLFLGAGSVIHALDGEQDMTRMGGLREKLPWTYRTMLVGALAIAGIPIFAGFFSKDEILWYAWKQGHPLLWAAAAAGAAMTAFYMFRLIYLTFHGSFRGTEERARHAHEPPPSMLAPLVILAALSIAGGWIGIPHSLGQLAGIPNVFEHYLAPALAAPALDAAHSRGAPPQGAAPAQIAGESRIDGMRQPGPATGTPLRLDGMRHDLPIGGMRHPDPATGAHPRLDGLESGERVRTQGDRNPLAGRSASNQADPATLEGSAAGTGAMLHAVGDGTGGGHGTDPMEYLLMIVSVAIAAGGILAARAFYGGRRGDLPERAARAAGPLYGLVANKYWVDELYDATVLRAYYAACRVFEGFDRWVVDGLVNAVAGFTEMVGQILRLFQTGFVRHYALLVFIGAVALIWMLAR